MIVLVGVIHFPCRCHPREDLANPSACSPAASAPLNPLIPRCFSTFHNRFARSIPKTDSWCVDDSSIHQHYFGHPHPLDLVSRGPSTSLPGVHSSTADTDAFHIFTPVHRECLPNFDTYPQDFSQVRLNSPEDHNFLPQEVISTRWSLRASHSPQLSQIR